MATATAVRIRPTGTAARALMPRRVRGRGAGGGGDGTVHRALGLLPSAAPRLTRTQTQLAGTWDDDLPPLVPVASDTPDMPDGLPEPTAEPPRALIADDVIDAIQAHRAPPRRRSGDRRRSVGLNEAFVLDDDEDGNGGNGGNDRTEGVVRGPVPVPVPAPIPDSDAEAEAEAEAEALAGDEREPHLRPPIWRPAAQRSWPRSAVDLLFGLSPPPAVLPPGIPPDLPAPVLWRAANGGPVRMSEARIARRLGPIVPFPARLPEGEGEGEGEGGGADAGSRLAHMPMDD